MLAWLIYTCPGTGPNFFFFATLPLFWCVCGHWAKHKKRKKKKKINIIKYLGNRFQHPHDPTEDSFILHYIIILYHSVTVSAVYIILPVGGDQ